jgi:phenazine biosynthesis protein phzE
MSAVIHTEYLLSGISNLSKFEIFKQSMRAPTVVGSPLESGFKVVKKYEKFDRRYYSAAIVYTDENTLDSSILIRTAEVNSKTGEYIAMAGVTIVKDSKPENEYEEVIAKLA